MTESLKNSVETVARPWEASPYYARAEQWTHLFWDKDSKFRKLFDRLDLTAVVELACGHGRHAEQILKSSGKLYLVDVLEENILYCKQRFGDHSQLVYMQCNGYNFEPIESSSVTSIFSYDAMVHFSQDIVESYLKDAARILKPAGMALFHHSNYSAPAARSFGQNPHARNHMTYDLFQDLAQTAKLTVEASEAIDWGGVKSLDRITLLQKPAVTPA